MSFCGNFISYFTVHAHHNKQVGLVQMVLKGVWWRIKNPAIRRFLHRTLYMNKRAGFVCEVVAKFTAKESIYLCNSSKINVLLPRYHCRLFFPLANISLFLGKFGCFQLSWDPFSKKHIYPTVRSMQLTTKTFICLCRSPWFHDHRCKKKNVVASYNSLTFYGLYQSS